MDLKTRLNDKETYLRSRLADLKQKGLSAVKSGTEVEDMSFEQIQILRDLTSGILPLFIKIGGPEARNDIRNLTRIGVDGLIAPMIESAYALRNFISTLKEILDGKTYQKLEKGINIETITAYRDIDLILSEPAAKELHQITAARTDLSGSMNMHPDHNRVLEACAIIVARSKEFELRTSIGGAIHSGIIHNLIEKCSPDTINTRHMVMHSNVQDPGLFLEDLLMFEYELYCYLASLPGPDNQRLAERVQVLKSRMQKSGAITA